ncbi:hypothetical protein NX059_012151 [Plenodomus lindquistii]|nr:hypothetical protein NX059_012151 [Plenodomus lindquistii]
MMALQDGGPAHMARYHYLRVENAEQMSARLAIGRRFHAARLREHYNRQVAREIQPKRQPPITKKKLGEVQAAFFLSVQPRGQAQHGNQEYETFLRTIKHGKRWLRLEREFGAGIFALLPKSRVPNTYIERTLTDNLFLLWMRVVSHCCPLVLQCARKLNDVVTRLADDMAPPLTRLGLEEAHEDMVDSEEATEELASLLEPADHPVRVREVADSDEEDVFVREEGGRGPYVRRRPSVEEVDCEELGVDVSRYRRQDGVRGSSKGTDGCEGGGRGGEEAEEEAEEEDEEQEEEGSTDEYGFETEDDYNKY